MSGDMVRMKALPTRHVAQAETANVPHGHKRTEVGVIPADWVIQTIGRVATIYGRIGFRGYTKHDIVEEGSGAIALNPSNILRNNLVLDDCTFVSWAKYHESPEIQIVNGDVILVKTGSTTGKTAYVSSLPIEATLNPQVVVFKKTKADNRFLAYLFATPLFLDQVAATIVGGALPTLSQKQVAAYRIPLPQTLSEQRAIADALSDVDGLLGALEALIAKKRAIKQAAMQQLLTGKTRLPGFSGEWETQRLGRHVTFLRHGTHSRADLTVDEPVRNLHYGDIHTSTEVFLSARETSMPRLAAHRAAGLDRLQNGDLVLVDASEDLNGVGKSVELTGATGIDVVSGLHTIAARFDKSVLADGFKGYLQFCPAFRQQLTRLAAGTKVYATNRAHIASVEMSLPRPDEQTAIATVLSDMDAEIAALETRRDKTRAIKQGMMQQLLTGRVRLVKPDEASAA